MRLAGKTAIVTGAGYGIGRGIAVRFGMEGACVAIAFGHDREKARETVRLVERAGASAIAVKCDVRRCDEVQDMVDTTLQAFGRVDILVNNAGVGRMTAFLDIPEEEWDVMLDTDLKGSFLCSQRAARAMVAGGKGGRIIHISSTQCEHPLAGMAHYASAKTGLIGLTRVMALELGPYHICVNTIAPGTTESELTRAYLSDPATRARALASIPIGRIGTPEDVAGLAVFLASSESDYVSGSTIYVDGGLLTSPNLV